MKFIWKYLKKYKKLLAATLILLLINQIFSLLEPYFFRLIIDDYLSKLGSFNSFPVGIWWLVFLMVGCSLIGRFAKGLQDYHMHAITQRVGANIYSDSLSHAMRLPYRNFENQKSGEILQKLQKGKTDCQNLIISMINILFSSMIGLAFILIYAFLTHWLIGIAFAALLPVLLASIYFFSRRIKQSQHKINHRLTHLAGSTTETLRNIELVKSLGLEQQEINRLQNANDDIIKLELKKILLVRILGFFQSSLVNLSHAAIILLLVWLMVGGQITLGSFMSIFFYLLYLVSPLSLFGQLAAQYQETKASIEQLQTILNQKPEDVKNDLLIDKIDLIEFDGVSFFYNNHSLSGIKDISLKINRGDVAAIVGPSGSGKTTLVKMISGLYQPQKGRLRINDLDGSLLNYDSWRNRIGLVSQETQLFSGSIKDNLLFARPDASEEDCLKVLGQAAVSGIMERGDRGLETVIGEGGMKLSGGERQRLAIARALLRKPDLLIFDEATSSLDSLTEKEIIETIKIIKQSLPDLIIILVAHRLSTVSQAEIIYVLEKGNVCECGNHRSLIDQGGLYAALWREQVGK